MSASVSKYVKSFLLFAFVVLAPIALVAQVAPSARGGIRDDSAAKWETFAGYSYLKPQGTVGGYSFNSVDYGAIMSISRYFNKNVGVQVEGDEHLLLPENGHVTSTQPNNDFSGISAGLIFRIPSVYLTSFVHALGGVEVVGRWGLGMADEIGAVVTAGGGLDCATPLFNHHLAIRLVQADYQYTQENFLQGQGTFNVARISAGLVFHAGSFTPRPAVTLECSASPASAFPGDPVTVTAIAYTLDPKLNAIYSWSGTGVIGRGTTANVATGALAAGRYTVKGSVMEGKPGKEGLKPGQTANCMASFTIKAYEPPTISCSAYPSTIKPGATSTVTAIGISPQNRPLTYSYSATAGTVSGSGTTAVFSSIGVPTGAVGITCTVSDDKGQTATASPIVTVEAPNIPSIPHTKALCSITFDKDKLHPARVDNEAKACLDEVALNLQGQLDAKAVVVGDSTVAEKSPTKVAKHAKATKVEDLAAERAVNTKDYLVTEKGIDASRIRVATGATDGQKVENYLVPSGAIFANDVTGTTPVDETMVKPQMRKPLPEMHVHN